MSNNNSPNSKAPPNSSNAPNHNQLSPQSNAVGTQNQPQLGSSSYQNHNLMHPFMPNMMQPPPMINAPPFMNVAHHLHPLQNKQLHLSHVRGLGPHNSVGNANYNNPMFPFHGQVMQNAPHQFNLSQHQGQILAQSILNMPQQPNVNVNMNMPYGQFRAPYPMQNMNQRFPMHVANPSQVVPYGMHHGPNPMFGFPNQVPQAMVPQNLFLYENPQFGHVPRNQVWPRINPNERNLVPPTANANAFASSPFPSQQLQGNSSAPLNPNLAQPHHKNNPQPSTSMKSNLQEKPKSKVKAKFPNSSWKGSPTKSLKNKPRRGGFQGGFKKSKFHDVNDGKRKIEFHKEHKGKGPVGNLGLNSEELQQEPQSEGKNTLTGKRKFRNELNKKPKRKRRHAKKRKFDADNKDFPESSSLNKREPTLLQKLLSADIKRDKGKLLHVLRFMVVNSFFKHYPDKPLIYPSVVVKEGDGEERHLYSGKDVEHDSKETVHDSDDGHDSEDEESDDDDDENDSMVPINPHEEPPSLVEIQCDSGKGIEKSSEEEGEVLEKNSRFF